MPEAVYAAVQRRWGKRGVVELVAVIGYYTMVSMTLNAHQMPLPEGASGLPPAATLVTLPPGTMRMRGLEDLERFRIDVAEGTSPR